MKLKMTVPPELCENGHLQCNDIIKVIVTAQPTSLDLLELPKLGESVMRSSTTRTSQEDGVSSSEDWAAPSFCVRTYIDVMDMGLWRAAELTDLWPVRR